MGKQLTWDMPVDPVIEADFRNWIKELPYLSAIRIPRWIRAGRDEAGQWTLHTFCDASKDALLRLFPYEEFRKARYLFIFWRPNQG